MKKQSITVNYFLNTAYQLLMLLTPLITAPYISRVLGAEGVGIYSYTTSVVAFFSMFAVLGTTTYGQRVIAQCRNDRQQLSKCFWEIEILSIITTFACIVVWMGIVLLNPTYRIYYLILTIELATVALDIVWFYNGLEKFSSVVFKNAAVKFLSIVLLFLLVRKRDHVWIYIAILALGKLVGNASMWIRLRRHVNGPQFSKLSIWPHFKETLTYFLPTAAASIYTYLDKIMIGTFATTSAENGYYEQARKITTMAYMMLASLNTVMSPRMSFLFSQKAEKEIRNNLENALAFIFTLGIPLVFGVAGIASNFVPWFFGDGFEKVSILLVLSSPLVVILALHNYFSALYLIPSGQRARSTKGVIAGASINLILNLIFIPKYQSVGAMIATLIAETSICVIYFYMSKAYVPLKLLLQNLPKQLLSACGMLFFIVLIGKGHSGSIIITVIQIIVGATVYFVLLYLLRERFTIRITERLMKKLCKRKS